MGLRRAPELSFCVPRSVKQFGTDFRDPEGPGLTKMGQNRPPKFPKLDQKIRSINKLEQRLIESSALGFKKAYIPRAKIHSNLNDIPIKFKSVKLVKDIFGQIF